MAEELDKKKVTALSELTTTSDNDIYITGEGGQAPLRKISFGTIAAGILNKLAAWTFSALNTTAKTLTGAINELNARLVTMPMPLISGLTTEELINTAYSDAHSNVINQTHYRRLLDHGMTHSVLGGGRYLLEGYRENAAYGWQITTSYALGAGTQPNKCFERSLINGTWSTWEKRPTRTEVDGLNSNLKLTKRDIRFENISFSAGTPGTRGAQAVDKSTIPSNEYIVAIFIAYTSDSSAVIPFAFCSGVTGNYQNIYFNAYRATSNAVSGFSVVVRVITAHAVVS